MSKKSTTRYVCLYVGKSTDIRIRFGLHLKRKSLGRLHTIPKSNRKQKPATTTCQLRHGIEHLFPDEPDPLGLIGKYVGYSFEPFGADEIAERFYRENLLIGTLKPWFNVDSER
ncbi:MAG: hypothetical protein JNM63_02520 [Spirochaetia bacterium]|nr:hypothetical protein [Spirochaetia bacterium]